MTNMSEQFNDGLSPINFSVKKGDKLFPFGVRIQWSFAPQSQLIEVLTRQKIAISVKMVLTDYRLKVKKFVDVSFHIFRYYHNIKLPSVSATSRIVAYK